MASAISQHGETVDQLCWRALGSTVPVEQVYAANPGLADRGTFLPAGIVVTLPDAVTTPSQTRETITLWS